VPDGPLEAQSGDLNAARGQPPGQRLQGLLHVTGRQLPELDLTEPLPECLDGVPVEFPGPVGPAVESVSQPVIQRVADRVGRTGPDAVVQVAAQMPELGPDLRPSSGRSPSGGHAYRPYNRGTRRPPSSGWPGRSRSNLHHGLVVSLLIESGS
jgi:hypothetical protein